MAVSIGYLVSVLVLFGALICVPKSQKRLPVIIWAVPLLLLIECYACAVGGVLTALNLPADILTISGANFVLAAVLIAYTVRCRKVQAWQLRWGDLLAAAVLLTVTGVIAWLRFTPELVINFETSDPSIHLQMAMDSMNLHSTLSYRGFMYIGQFTNSLFLQAFRPFVPFEDLYKVFIVKLICNWAASGLVFYACIAHRAKSRFGRLLAILCAVGYFCGYPLTDLIFGFVYLQQCMTSCMLILFLLDRAQSEELCGPLRYPALSVNCLAISLGYILFAPSAYIAVALSLTLWYWKQNHALFRWRYFRMQLSVFVFPTFMTLLYYFVLVKRYKESNSMSSLTAEGYIYRNLYSDFVLLLPLALFGLYLLWKHEKETLLASLTPIAFLTAAVLLIAMITGKVSTYYYYKVNFLLWTVLWLCAAAAVLYLDEQMKALAVSIAVSACFLAAMFLGKAEWALYQSGIQVSPGEYAESEAWFRNYNFNRQVQDTHEPYSEEKVELYQAAIPYAAEAEEELLFAGDWLDNFWFQAIADTRNDGSVYLTGEDEVQYFKWVIGELSPGTLVVLMNNFEDYCGEDEQAAEARGAEIASELGNRGSVVFENDAGTIYQIG